MITHTESPSTTQLLLRIEQLSQANTLLQRALTQTQQELALVTAQRDRLQQERESVAAELEIAAESIARARMGVR